MGAIIGTLIVTALESITTLTRAGIAASLREVADRVERGDIVSDDAINSLKDTTQKIRDLRRELLEKAKKPIN